MKKIIFIFILILSTADAQNVSKLDRYVTDEAGVLKADELSAMENKLRNFDKQTSTQIVVYILRTLSGDAIENVSHKIATENKIGQKGKNNGILLLIAIDDRKMRIEVGYGLEGAVTDALCSQIIRKEITPEFKTGNYYKGIDSGIEALMDAAKGEYTTDPVGENSNSGWWIPIVIVGVFLAFGVIMVLSAFKSAKSGSGNRNGYSYSNWNYSGSSYSSSDSSSSGSSDTSSGFSGGGGDFGGGGASGSW